MYCFFRSLAVGSVYLLLTTACFPQAPSIPRHHAGIALFDGKDLSHFDIFLKDHGINSDPDHVFQVERGLIHVSGTEMGYIVTKEPYSNYYLRASFKWGEGTYGVRKDKARDSGILFGVVGEPKVWPHSIEFQIQEGCTGDFWLTDGASLTDRQGHRVEAPPGKAIKVDRVDKAPFTDIVGFRPPDDLDKRHGEWNLVELVVQGTTVRQYVNGKLANEATDVSPQLGLILFQSEGAEIFFKDISLYPLK